MRHSAWTTARSWLERPGGKVISVFGERWRGDEAKFFFIGVVVLMRSRISLSLSLSLSPRKRTPLVSAPKVLKRVGNRNAGRFLDWTQAGSHPEGPAPASATASAAAASTANAADRLESSSVSSSSAIASVAAAAAAAP